MTVKTAETREAFQKQALDFVISKKSHSRILHSKNGCSCSNFLAKYIDFDSVDAAIGSGEFFIPCKTCFAKDKYPLEENLPTAKDVCKQAIRALYLSQTDVAHRLFERFIQLEPHQPLGYVGLATVEAIPDDAVIQKYCNTMSPAFQMTCAPEYQEDMHRLVNFFLDKDRMTILMYATYAGELEAVRFLIRMGADVNLKCSFLSTALWYIAHEPLKIKANEKREIAKLLLANGAHVDVTNSYGVALYNKYTDAEIATLIKAKYPSLAPGYTPEIDEPEPPQTPPQDTLSPEAKRALFILIAFVVAGIILLCMIFSLNDGGKKWSDLSDTEKENAIWADQVLDELEKRN